ETRRGAEPGLMEQARSEDRVSDLARAQPLLDRAFRGLERRARSEILERDVDEPRDARVARSIDEVQLPLAVDVRDLAFADDRGRCREDVIDPGASAVERVSVPEVADTDLRSQLAQRLHARGIGGLTHERVRRRPVFGDSAANLRPQK